MQKKTIHMIGNAHIDPVWLWQWQEGFQEVKATFRSALDRMNEDADFIFSASAAAYYAWVEENDPEMFEEIKRRVAEGRWQIVGGWWVEPDCNIPGGEAFARQSLYSQRYFKEKFGVMAHVGYNVDSFGHSAMLPQILRKSGMDSYIFMRPSPHEKGIPGRLFWWESDDGSRVLAFRLPYEYVSWGKDIEQHVRRCAQELRPPFDETMCFFGVGNHGGGPTRENLASIHRLMQDPMLPKLVFSSPNQFFTSVCEQEGPVPVVHGDLQHHASGCYAAHSGIKRWNRQAENRLLSAEKVSTLLGKPARKELAHAWKNVLFNQFHDILAGTSIEAAYEDARNSYGEAMAIADRVLNSALQNLTWRIHIEPEEGMKPVVVFNPHAWAVKEPVELEFGEWKEDMVVLDDQDTHVPVQVVQSRGTALGRSRLCFVADLPPLGYRTYRVARRSLRTEFPAPEASTCALENARWQLEIDHETGCISRLYDKVNGVNVFLDSAARLFVIDDHSDTWGHNVFKFDHVVDQFTPVSIRLVEQGPVKSVIRVESRYNASALIQEFALYSTLDRIDVHVVVDWREKFKMLKLRFPLKLNMMTATYEIPYGHIERFANGEEEPLQSWVDVSGIARDTGEPYGLSVLNDGKYSADVNIRDIGLTVLRSPIYAHHMPLEPDPDDSYAFIDQGIQEFNYILLPHKGSWEQAGTVRSAAVLNQPPIALVETYHPQGKLPQSDSFLSAEPENIIVTAVKEAEDGDGWIIRAYETAQTTTHASICLRKWNRIIEADFGPCEIKTWRVPRDTSLPIVETNLLEM